MVSNQEIIVKVGADGGDLTLYGVRTSNGWSFSLNLYDCTPLLLDDDEGGAAIQERSSPTTSWADAMALLDKYPWAKLYPLDVHPEFRRQIWSEVQKRLHNDGDASYALDDWRRKCE